MFAALQGSSVSNISFKHSDGEAIQEYQSFGFIHVFGWFSKKLGNLDLEREKKKKKKSIPVELLPLSKIIKN